MMLLNRILTFIAVAALVTAAFMPSLPAALAAGVMVGVVILRLGLDIRAHQRRNDQKPIVTTEATVLSHRTTTERVGKGKYILYWVAFRTADGARLEFNVSQLDYEDFDIGETDLLRYRGWQFLSFGVKDKSHIKPIAPLPEEYEPVPEPDSALASICEKVAGLWTNLTSRKARQPDESLPTKDNGILTHELDE